MNTNSDSSKRLFNPRYPLLAAFLAAAGSFIGVLCSWNLLFYLASAVILIFFILLFILKKRRAFLAACLLILILFALYASFIDKQKTIDNFDEVAFSGRIVSSWEKHEAGYTVEFSDVVIHNGNCDISIRNKTLLFVYSNAEPKWEYGDELFIKGTIGGVEPPRNEGEPDYRRSYLAKGIVYSASALPNDIQKTGHQDDLYGVFVRIREKICSNIEAATTQRTTSLTEGLLLGMDDKISSEIMDQFRLLGIVHILSVSGLHVGILVLALRGLLKKVKTGIWARFIILTVFLTAYSAITAFTAPVMRASFMAVCLLLAETMGKRYDGLNILGAVAFILLLLNPMQIYSVGFVMSFLACFGIFLYADSIKIKIPVMKQIVSGAMLTVSAQFGILPILINLYGYVSPVSILANLLLSVPVSIIIITALIFSFLSLIFPAAGILLLSFLEPCMTFFMMLVNGMEPLAKYVVNLSAMPVYVIAGYYLMLIYFSKLTLIKFRIKLITAAGLLQASRIFCVVCTVIIIAFSNMFNCAYNNKIEITLLSVGSADCTVIQTEQNIYLIDTASTNYFNAYQNNSGEKVLLPYLQKKGICYIDGIFLTHDHSDHTGGLLALYNKIDVGTIYYDAVLFQDKNIKKLLQLYQKKGTELKPVCPYDTIHCTDDFIIDVLYPLKDTTPSDNTSTVYRVLAYNTKLLFLGDNESNDLTALLSSSDLSCDIIIAPHHGSTATDYPDLYHKLSPKVILVSSGEEFITAYTKAVQYNTNNCGSVKIIIISGKEPKIIPYIRK